MLYPYVPDWPEYQAEVVREFEARRPGVRLDVIDLTDDYYDDDASTCGSVSRQQADVYELDSVLLDDFIASQRIQALPASFDHDGSAYLPMARDVAQRSGHRWGVPHWVCGNFLFFRNGDTQLESVHSLADLEHAIGTIHSPGRGFLMDLAGTSTLGEAYVDSALDRYGRFEEAQPHLTADDDAIESDLVRVLNLCDVDQCHDDAAHRTPHHNALGYFPQEFAHGRARAFAGYSESLFYALSERCSGSSPCLQPNEVHVSALPLADRGSQPIAWVDVFTIDSHCHDSCADDAEAFIRFMDDEATLLGQLRRRDLRPPTYLMPARATLYSNETLLRDAPLYPRLRELMDSSVVPSGPGLNHLVRERGRNVKSRLREAEQQRRSIH